VRATDVYAGDALKIRAMIRPLPAASAFHRTAARLNAMTNCIRAVPEQPSGEAAAML